MLLTSVIASPQPGVCYFGDSNGDCVIDAFDVKEAKKSTMLKPGDYSNVVPQSSDVQDLDGNGVVDIIDVKLLKNLMLLKSSNIDGVPTKILNIEAPIQLDINDLSTITVSVTDNDGTPRAGIGVLFTIDSSSTGTATLTGRDPANGDNVIDSNTVFELTNTISEGGEATITINPLTSGSLIIRTFMPGDKSKGVDDIIGKDIIINLVDGQGTITNSAPLFNNIIPVTAYSNELIQFTISATDADNDGLTYDFVSGPGSFDSITQTYTWTPSQSDKTGSATFYDVIFSVSDGVSVIEDSTTITLINRIPEISTIEDIITDENGFVYVTPIVTDADGDVLTVTYSEKLDSNGVWQTNFDSAGDYEIIAIASDGINSAGRTFTINVNDVVQDGGSSGSGGGSGGSTGSNSYHNYVNVVEDEVEEDVELEVVEDVKEEDEVTDITVEEVEEKSFLDLIKEFFVKVVDFIKNLF